MNNEEIVLLRPPVCFSKDNILLSVAPPLGLAYLAGTLKTLKYNYSVIDSVSMGFDQYGETENPEIYYRGLSTSEIISRINTETKMLLVSCMFVNDWNHTRRVIQEIKKTFPNIVIIAGGETVSALPDFILDDCPEIEYVGLGEGESFLIEFCEAFFKNEKLTDIEGLAYRSGNNVIVNRETKRRIKKVDTIPWPDWSKFHIETYLDNSVSFGTDIGRVMPFNASRGCAYSCSFCSSPNMWGTRYIPRDTKDIIDEIIFYKENYKIDAIEFHDLTLFMRKTWMNQFLKEMIERNVNLSWNITIGTRVEGFDKENIALLKKAGCTYLTFAPESGSNETLKYVNKRLKVERIYEKVKIAVDEKLATKINVIIGFPEEKRFGILQSLWMITRCAYLGVNDISISIFYPYPGSKLFDDLIEKEEMILNRDYFNSLYSNEYFKVKKHYCRNVGDRELTYYCLFGIISFYFFSYLFHPIKLLQFINGYRSKNFKTRLEKFLVGSTKANVGTFKIKDLKKGV